VRVTGATGYIGGRLVPVLEAAFRLRCLALWLGLVTPVDARFGGKLVDARRVHVAVDADRAFAPIARIVGERGWYFGTWMWRVRGAVDLLMGGVGMRRGRRDPDAPAVGDTLDFWRVEAYEPGRRLRLAAEMKVPGRAWLEFEIVPVADGAVVHQTAVFEPIGLPGLLYWYVLLPVHALIFACCARSSGAPARMLIVTGREQGPHRDRV
jgi:hypothetical protein